MRSSDLISLFEEPHSAHMGVPSFFVSSVAHAAALGLLSYGLLHGPQIQDPLVTERYSVRHLELHTPPSATQDPQSSSDSEPETSGTTSVPDLHPLQLELPVEPSGQQMLVQPNFRVHTALAQKALVPTVMIWTPELASIREIVAPSPDMPTAAPTRPVLDAPNEELKLGDLAVASTEDTRKPMPVAPGTTSPIAMHAPELLAMAPATASISEKQPTPTALLSLSDVRMKEGTILLPPVNETRTMKPSATTSAGGQTAATSPGHPIFSAGKHDSEKNGTSAGKGLEAPPQSGGDAEGAVEHITLPKGGRFGVVVVGASVADEYPESLQVWSDRVAYTAYLHVGLTKNWILEYAQTKAADAENAGTVARLEAPWPYDIFRPNLVTRDLNADALMVHGVVNQSGRFESLAIAFPAQYARAAFVLHTLQQWQFRPARQNGKPVPVEVLLIIPEELD